MADRAEMDVDHVSVGNCEATTAPKASCNGVQCGVPPARSRPTQTSVAVGVGVATIAVFVAAVVAAFVVHPSSANSTTSASGPKLTSPPMVRPPTTVSNADAGTGPVVGPAPSLGSAVPAGFLPSSVSFVSPTDGWALGTAPCGPTRCTILAHTDSAGWAWTTLTAPPGSVDGVRFANKTAGYAFGQRSLDVTVDGGKTWRPLALRVTGNLVALEIGAGEAFLAVAADPATDPYVALYRAPVGGDSFTPVDGVRLSHSSTARLSFDGHFGYLWSLSPINGVVVTSDGGTTWSNRDLPCPSGGNAAVMLAAIDEGLQVVCSAPGAGGQFAKSYYFSIDAAATFHVDHSVVPPADGQLDDLAAFGPEAVVLATASAGSSLFRLAGDWKTVLRPITGGTHWHDLGFTTITQGVVILGNEPGPGDEGAGMYMTRDSGQHWTLIDFGVSALPARCAVSQLNLTQPADGGRVGLGNVTTPLVFTNHASASCSLDGYPGVTLTDASGHALPNSTTRSTSSYLLQNADVEPVVLGPNGGTATFFLSYTDNPIEPATSCPAAKRARVYPPNDTQIVVGQVDIQPCGNILISPVVARQGLE